MKNYEAMFIVRPDLAEDERKTLLSQMGEAVTKNNGSVTQTSVWAERRKLSFPIKKHHEGTYYLVNFTVSPDAIAKLTHAYKLNENILRVLISVL